MLGESRNSDCWPRFVIATLATLVVPPLLFKFALEKKHRSTLVERFAYGPWREEPPSACPRIWIHAASVGEVAGITPLLSRFDELGLADGILITTTSNTGRRKALEMAKVCSVRLLPLDHPWILSRALDNFCPDICLITETELWPNFLFSLQSRGVPTVLVNARISDYTFPNYYRFRRLIAPALKTFDLILAQTDTDRERFLKLGVSEEKLGVIGSTKYDKVVIERSAELKLEYAQALGIDLNRPCFVAGSVRETEDRMVLDAYLLAKETVPELQMIFAPRHPERFSDSAALLSSRGISFNRRSGNQVEVGNDIMLLDTLGELEEAYSLASFSFIGASLVDIGGHNPLEAAAYASPVLMGPYSSNVKDAVTALKRAGGFFEVGDSKQLAEVIVLLAGDKQLRELVGAAAQGVWRSNLGATDRFFEAISPLLESHPVILSKKRKNDSR